LGSGERQRESVPCEEIVEGSRVAVMVDIEHWKGKEQGVEGSIGLFIGMLPLEFKD
jgi:hypothetical protein